MEKLTDLPNIGKVVAEQLNTVGIHNYRELKDIGSENAWLRIQKIDTSACMNRLLGIEGAILGIKKTLIPEARKDQLRQFYQAHK